MENKTIRIYGAEKTTQGENKKKFIKWSYTKDGKTFYEVKFTSECAIPSKRGYYLLTINPKKVNIKVTKTKTYYNEETDSLIDIKPNDIMWVQEIINIVPDKEYEAELEKKRLDDVMAVL